VRDVADCNGRMGWIIGESTPLYSYVVFEKCGDPPTAGTYVVADGPQGRVLGIVELVLAGHPMLPRDITDPAAVDTIARWQMQGVDETYIKGRIRWLTLVDTLVRDKKVVAPKTPVLPGSDVWRADTGLLSSIFAPSRVDPAAYRWWVRLGHLASDRDVEFQVDVRKIFRHLAILAVTGGGKSNTVCILAKRIVSQLRGTMVVFDLHGEYVGLPIQPKKEWTGSTPAGVNPVVMSVGELLRLAGVGYGAHVQERFIRWAWRVATHQYWHGRKLAASEVFDKALSLLLKLEEAAVKKTDLPQEIVDLSGEAGVSIPPVKGRLDSLEGAIARLEDVGDKYSSALNPQLPVDLPGVIPPGHLTVFDLSTVDEDGADAIVAHYLRRILMERKRAKVSRGAEGYPVPIYVVLEEAHVLVPRDRDTLTKTWAARIAREGRKFGVGLILVSQRPKNVDANVLSQTNNKIILRIVEPEDIRYVQRASEELSDDLASLLPSLNPGEAVVLGQMTRLPSVVQIDFCEEKKRGGDEVEDEWASYMEEKLAEKEELDAYF